MSTLPTLSNLPTLEIKEDCPQAALKEMLDLVYEYNLVRIWKEKWCHTIHLKYTKELTNIKEMTPEISNERLSTIRSRFLALTLQHSDIYLDILKKQNDRIRWFNSINSLFQEMSNKEQSQLCYNQGSLVKIVPSKLQTRIDVAVYVAK